MALITCKECSTEVSSEAKTCPKCGARVKPASKAWMWILGVPLALFIVFAVIGANDPQAEQKAKDRMVFEQCVKDMNDPLKSPVLRMGLRGVCEKFRDDFVKAYGHKP